MLSVSNPESKELPSQYLLLLDSFLLLDKSFYQVLAINDQTQGHLLTGQNRNKLKLSNVAFFGSGFDKSNGFNLIDVFDLVHSPGVAKYDVLNVSSPESIDWYLKYFNSK